MDRFLKAGNLRPVDYAPIFELCEALQKPLVIYDTETSGFLEQKNSEILELAFLCFEIKDGYDEIFYDGSLILNTYPIPKDVTEINGIDDALCQTGKHWDDVWNVYEPFFSNSVVSGFNSKSYDSFMIRKMQRIHGGEEPWFEELDVRSVHFGITGQKKGTLSTLCEANGIPVIDAHQAMADVIMTAGLLKHYIEHMGIERVLRYKRKTEAKTVQKATSMRMSF